MLFLFATCDDECSAQDPDNQAKQVDLLNFHHLPLELRQSKMNEFLKELSGRYFIEVIANAIHNGGFSDWPLEKRLSYLNSALTKKDADFSEDPQAMDTSSVQNLEIVCSAVLKSVKETGVNIENNEELRKSVFHLEQFEERKKFLDLLTQAKARIAAQSVTPVRPQDEKITTSGPAPTPPSWGTPNAASPELENRIPVWIWIAGGLIGLLLIVLAFVSRKNKQHR